MTLNPNHVLMNAVAHERQARLRATSAAPRRPSASLPVRVRVGRMLISVGTSLSGDRLERAQHSHARQAA